MSTIIDTAAADADLDDMLGESSLPEVEVPLCLNGKLRRQYDTVKARIDARAAQAAALRTVHAAKEAGLIAEGGGDDRLGVRTPDPDQAVEADPEQAELDELAAQMRRFVKVFVVRAMPTKEWNRLLELHPPRKNPSTGKLDDRDFEGMNSATYYPALVRASIASHDMSSDERWDRFNEKISDAQFDKLVKAAVEVNRRDEDIPFSLLDSETPPS